MNECPKCQKRVPQVKAGTTSAGSQRYRCTACRHKDTPVRKARGYPAEVRQRVVHEYGDGRNLRQIDRQFGVVHTLVVAKPEARVALSEADVACTTAPSPLRWRRYVGHG